jgi:Spy/CpxP family protein refolding chaperone
MTRFNRRCRLAGLLAGLATTIVANSGFAQGATITGTVRSSQGQALQAANVRIRNANASVGTGADGVYRMVLSPDRVQGQQVTLDVRAIGYVPQSKQITITAGTQHHDFTLHEDPNRSSGVVVRYNLDTVPTSRTREKPVAFTISKAGNTSVATTSDFSQHLFPPELIMQNQGRLRITESQREAILQEIYKVQATAAQVQWRVSDESEKLNQLLERENVQESEALAQADRMMTWEIAVKRAQLTMLIRIRNLLTAEQKAMLMELRRRE